MNGLSARIGLVLALLVAALLAGLVLSGLVTLQLLKLDGPLAWNTYLRYAAALDLPEVRPYAGTIKLAGVLGFGISVLAWAVGSCFLLRSAPSTSQPRAAVGTVKPPPLRKAEFTGDKVERAEQPVEKSFVYYTEEGADMRYATPAVAAAASLALAACATPSRDKATPTASAANLNATVGNTVPVNPAERLGQKLLALIGGLRSTRDLTVERVNAALGVQMPEDPEWPGEHEIEIPLNERRYSWIRFEPPSEHSGALLKFSITRPMHDRTEPLPLTPVCLEFEPFATALEKLGYTREEKKFQFTHYTTGDWRFYRRKPEHEYTEDELASEVSKSLEGLGPVEISIESPQGEFATKFGQSAGGRRCILSLEVEAKGSES